MLAGSDPLGPRANQQHAKSILSAPLHTVMINGLDAWTARLDAHVPCKSGVHRAGIHLSHPIPPGLGAVGAWRPPMTSMEGWRESAGLPAIR